MNVEQNISLGQNIADYKHVVRRLIDLLGLSSKIKCLARELSLGEAQRVAIARGVVKPEVIFADEPTSALDDNNAKKFVELILSRS